MCGPSPFAGVKHRRGGFRVSPFVGCMGPRGKASRGVGKHFCCDTSGVIHPARNSSVASVLKGVKASTGAVGGVMGNSCDSLCPTLINVNSKVVGNGLSSTVGNTFASLKGVFPGTAATSCYSLVS